MTTVFPLSPSNGDTYIPPQVQKLLASDPATDDFFGTSVSLSSDGLTLLVGASHDDTSPNTGNGAAYIFTRSGTTWTQQQKLLASDPATDDFFGWSVALSADGNTAIVGAFSEDTSPITNQGAAYVFTRSGSTWTEQQKLLASDPATTDRFGYSVTLSSDGNTALIGASIGNSVYVFTRTTGVWTEQQILTASDVASNEQFGYSVALSEDGNTALVGNRYEDTSPNTDNGAAYVFTLSAGTWTQQQKLLASDRASNDEFGHVVAISADGNTAIVGAFSEDTSPNTDQGAAYVFTRTAGVWTEQQKLLAPDAATNDDFGYSVALSADGNTAIVGAINEDTSPNTDNGAVYVFTRSAGTWTQQQKIVASDRATSDSFGSSVALSSDGSIVIVGVSSENTSPTSRQGAVYTYNFNNIGTRYTYNSTDNRWEVDTSIPKKAPTTHLFTSSVSSWTIPTSARVIYAVCIAGGGAGGGGGEGTSVAGGGGGGGGGMSIHTYNLISGYQTTAVITVGAGGVNTGTAATPAAGGSGGTSSFRIADSGSLGTLTASGGSGGGIGGATSSTAGSGGLGMFNGGAGGAGVDTGSNSSSSTASGPRGGGSGGGNDTSNRTGGNGGTSTPIWSTTTISPGIGGTGGTGSTSSNGDNGSAGVIYGGGGGGGGAGITDGSGIGGNGAQGCVFLTVWYE